MFLKKLKIKLPCDYAIPLLGIYLKKKHGPKRCMHAIFIAAMFTIVTTWKQHKCPLTEEWIKEML